MPLLDTLKRLFVWWDGQTLNTQFFTWRKGVRVGKDAQGNVFYRDAADRRRWVIFHGEAEASRIAPEWHGWLHRTQATPPSEAPPLRKPWEKPHRANPTGTPDAELPAGSIRRAAPAPRRDYEAWSPE